MGNSKVLKKNKDNIIKKGWHAPKFAINFLKFLGEVELRLFNECPYGTSLLCIVGKAPKK